MTRRSQGGLLLLLLTGWASPARLRLYEKRVALIIGNSDYEKAPGCRTLSRRGADGRDVQVGWLRHLETCAAT